MPSLCSIPSRFSSKSRKKEEVWRALPSSANILFDAEESDYLLTSTFGKHKGKELQANFARIATSEVTTKFMREEKRRHVMSSGDIDDLERTLLEKEPTGAERANDAGDALATIRACYHPQTVTRTESATPRIPHSSPEVKVDSDSKGKKRASDKTVTADTDWQQGQSHKAYKRSEDPTQVSLDQKVWEVARSGDRDAMSRISDLIQDYDKLAETQAEVEAELEHLKRRSFHVLRGTTPFPARLDA